ncbi:MAG: nucleotidyltransferase domain-containing protein [Actinomycetota bacterium]
MREPVERTVEARQAGENRHDLDRPRTVARRRSAANLAQVSHEAAVAPAARVTTQQWAVYRAAQQSRLEKAEQEGLQRRERAWKLARRAARLLRERFGATRVVVFGSLVHEDCFTRWSDVDVAAWGLRPADTFRAMGAVADLDADIEVNLVDMGACRASLRDVIEREGIEV